MNVCWTLTVVDLECYAKMFLEVSRAIARMATDNLKITIKIKITLKIKIKKIRTHRNARISTNARNLSIHVTVDPNVQTFQDPTSAYVPKASNGLELDAQTSTNAPCQTNALVEFV